MNKSNIIVKGKMAESLAYTLRHLTLAREYRVVDITCEGEGPDYKDCCECRERAQAEVTRIDLALSGIETVLNALPWLRDKVEELAKHDGLSPDRPAERPHYDWERRELATKAWDTSEVQGHKDWWDAFHRAAHD